MPRPMLIFPETKSQTDRKQELNLRQTSRSKSKTNLSPMEVERVLNRKRSAAYIQAMTHLDAGAHMHNAQLVEELQEAIRREMPEIEIDLGPIGIVAKCYLGAPYEVHTLDMSGGIIEHFETFRTMPQTLERARKLATSGFYAFIEVYHHALRAVKEDGTVAVLKG